MGRRCWAVLITVLVTAGFCAPVRAAAAPGFVQRQGIQFVQDGQRFRFFGANNPTLQYKPAAVVESVLDAAVAMNLKVIRVFPGVERGSADGSVPSVGPDRGMWTQAWDPAAGRVVFNDGPDGLERVDRLLAEAAERGLKLELMLTDNDREVGGIEQYDAWFGLGSHDAFFTDARARAAYRDWVDHLTARVNSVTGVRYRDDPTIFAWELADGPRCFGVQLSSAACGRSGTTITTWAREMSGYLRSVDPNHLIGVGDEGFVNGTVGLPRTLAESGVDSVALARLPDVDFATFQVRPDAWGVPDSWVSNWVSARVSGPAEDGKPAVLTELSRLDPAARDGFLGNTLDDLASVQFSGEGWILQTLNGHLPDGTPEPDPNGAAIVHPSTTSTVVTTVSRPLPPAEADTTAPLAPRDLALRGTPTGTSVRLLWRRGLDDRRVVSHRVLRLDGESATELGRTDSLSSHVESTLDGFVAGQRYTLAVTALDAAGHESPPSTPVTFTMPGSGGDLAPPSVPGELRVTALTGSSATLSWAASTDDVTVSEYRVDEQMTAEQPREVTRTAATAVTLRHLFPGVRYTFLVRARDASRESQPASISFQTPEDGGADTTPPTAPGTPVATSITWSAAELRWAPATDDRAVTGYVVQQVGSTPFRVGLSTQLSLNALRPLTRYSYAVAALDRAGNQSPWSAPVTFVTTARPDTSPPTRPGQPVASGVTATSAVLSWPASRDDTAVSGYRVVRLGPAGETPVLSVTGPTATLTGLTPETTSDYAVYALDAAGNVSPRSEPVTVTTPPAPAGGCQVTYQVNDWGGGFTAQLGVTNTGPAAVDGWSLRFTFPGNQRISSGWSATWTQSGADVRAEGPGWNRVLAAGATVAIGFNADYSGPNLRPAAFTLNGVPCQLS